MLPVRALTHDSHHRMLESSSAQADVKGWTQFDGLLVGLDGGGILLTLHGDEHLAYPGGGAIGLELDCLAYIRGGDIVLAKKKKGAGSSVPGLSILRPGVNDLSIDCNGALNLGYFVIGKGVVYFSV